MKEIQYKKRNSKEIFVEAVPGAENLNRLYSNSLGKMFLHLFIKRKIVSKIFGWIMDLPFSARFINSFIEDYRISMTRFEKAIDEFTSFNDFFTRKLTTQNREIEDNIGEIISPSDGKILAYQITNPSDDFSIKNNNFTIRELIKNKKLSDLFTGGAAAVIRLAPTDYHRFHFPVNGEIGENHQINGELYSVSPLALQHNKKIFEMNKREFSIIESADFGKVLFCEIGATFVGSIKQTYKPGKIKKGDEKGYFKFGGSTIVLLFQRNKIEFDKDIIDNTKLGYETEIKFGERIAQRRNDE